MTENEKAEFIRKLRIGKNKGGHLEMWGKHYLHQTRYSGIVTNDPNDRFEDGECITTSPCIKMHDINGVKILETEQSYYTLGDTGTYEDRERFEELEDRERDYQIGWMVEADPFEGQAVHRTKDGKGAVGQAIAKDKLRKLPPNCS